MNHSRTTEANRPLDIVYSFQQPIVWFQNMGCKQLKVKNARLGSLTGFSKQETRYGDSCFRTEGPHWKEVFSLWSMLVRPWVWIKIDEHVVRQGAYQLKIRQEADQVRSTHSGLHLLWHASTPKRMHSTCSNSTPAKQKREQEKSQSFFLFF